MLWKEVWRCWGKEKDEGAAASLTASWRGVRRSCEMAAEDDQLELSKEQELLSAGGRSQGGKGAQPQR